MRGEFFHLVLQRHQLLREVQRLGRERLARQLMIDRIELREITSHALFELRAPPFHLALGEVPIAVVNGFELAAVDRDARCRQQPHPTAELDEARADVLDRWSVVLAEIGDHLVVGNQTSEQPDDFEIAPGLPFQAPARLHTVEATVDVQFEQDRGMVCWASCRRRRHALETEIPKIEPIYKDGSAGQGLRRQEKMAAPKIVAI